MLQQLPVHESSEERRVRTWVQLVRTYQRVERQLSSCLAEHGLTLAQYETLAILRYSEGISQQQLAEALLVTKGNVCGLIDRLSRQGWVERRPDRDDGRAYRLYLTASGRRKIAQATPHHDATVLAALAPLSDPTVEALRQSLAVLA
jgi:DNA-binding MarR family transcriptional regulator